MSCHYGDGKKNKNKDGKFIYEEHKKMVQKFADEVGLPLFILNSNFTELFPMDHEMVDVMRNCGAVLMFQKMFDIYYYSSSYPLNDFHLDTEKGSGYYEIYTLPNISTNSTTFYSFNSTYDRLRKTMEKSYKKRKGMLMDYALAFRKETYFKELVPLLKKKKNSFFKLYLFYLFYLNKTN